VFFVEVRELKEDQGQVAIPPQVLFLDCSRKFKNSP
jgi:hypothetical protein